MNPRAVIGSIALILIFSSIYWFHQATENSDDITKPDVQAARPLIEDQLQPSATLPSLQKQPLGFTVDEKKIVDQIYARFHMGDYGVALGLADKSLASSTISPLLLQWINEQMPNLLTAQAWVKIKLESFDEAIALLTRAIALTTTPEILKGLAYSYYRLQVFPLADEYSKNYLAANPGDHEIALIYADLLETELRFDEAVAVLEKTVQTLPENVLVKNKLEPLRRRAKESVLQTQLSSDYFSLIFRSNQSDEVTDLILETLNAAANELIDTWSFHPPRAKIEVILYPRDKFKGMINQGPDWAAGIFDGRIRVPLKSESLSTAETDELKKVLRHELVHAMIANMTSFRQIPSWINEGFAQYFECSSPCPRNFFPPTPGEFLSMESLLVPYTSYSVVKADQSYRQSLYLVYVLQEDSEISGSDSLARIIQGLGTERQDLSSDGLLKASGLSFQRLHERASFLWNRGHRFGQ